MKPLSEIKFGARDVRWQGLDGSPEEKILFLKNFIFLPPVSLVDFTCDEFRFISGIKGQGKSALLRYIQIAESAYCACRVVYFRKANERALSGAFSVEDANGLAVGSARDTWRLFIFINLVSGMVADDRLRDQARPLADALHRLRDANLEFFEKAKLSLSELIVEIKSKALTGRAKFEPVSLEGLPLSAALDVLMLRLQRMRLVKPLRIFIDEVELPDVRDRRFEVSLKAVSALVSEVAEMNEEFSSSDFDCKIFCAVRSEVLNAAGADEAFKYEDITRKVQWTDRATEVLMRRTGLHPLLRIAAGRVYYDENQASESMSDEDALKVLRQRLPFLGDGLRAEKFILDLTLYRPRDIVVAMRILADNPKNHNQVEASRDSVLYDLPKELGRIIWSDISGGLLLKYGSDVLRGVEDLLAEFSERESGVFYLAEAYKWVHGNEYDSKYVAIYDLGVEEFVNLFETLFFAGIIGNATPSSAASRDFDRSFAFRGALKFHRKRRLCLQNAIHAYFKNYVPERVIRSHRQ